MSSALARTAIVTGAARGIGRAIALVDLRAEELAHSVAEVEALGFAALLILADTSSHRGAHEHVAKIVEAWGRIDVLVNNAAVPQPKRFLEITEAEWDAGTAVNLKGYFN